MELFARACELDRRDASAALLLAGTLAERDDLTGARAAYAQAEASDAADAACVVRPLPDAADGAGRCDGGRAGARRRFRTACATVEREAPSACSGLVGRAHARRAALEQLSSRYQGGDDKPLQARFANVVHGLVKARAPEWLRPLSRRVRAGSRVKVGFLSTFFRDSTAGSLLPETGLPIFPRRFRGVCVSPVCPASIRLRIGLPRAPTISGTVRGGALRNSRRAFAPTRSMCSCTRSSAWARFRLRLAALRLAPLQCAGWGHPVTSGHPTIDVFFSSAVMEPPDGAARITPNGW